MTNARTHTHTDTDNIASPVGLMSEPKRSFTGRKTPASTGTKIKTAWSDVVTIISVLLFFTARIESTVGSEKKT